MFFQQDVDYSRVYYAEEDITFGGILESEPYPEEKTARKCWEKAMKTDSVNDWYQAYFAYRELGYKFSIITNMCYCEHSRKLQEPLVKKYLGL